MLVISNNPFHFDPVERHNNGVHAGSPNLKACEYVNDEQADWIDWYLFWRVDRLVDRDKSRSNDCSIACFRRLWNRALCCSTDSEESFRVMFFSQPRSSRTERISTRWEISVRRT